MFYEPALNNAEKELRLADQMEGMAQRETEKSWEELERRGWDYDRDYKRLERIASAQRSDVAEEVRKLFPRVLQRFQDDLIRVLALARVMRWALAGTLRREEL